MGRLDELIPDGIRTLRKFDSSQPGTARAVLDRNELPWPLDADLMAALTEHLRSVDLNRYGDPEHSELRTIVARDLGVPESSLLFGNGSHELIPLLVAAFAKPRDGSDGRARVLYPVPSFVVYRIAALTHAVPVEVPLMSEFQLDFAALHAAFRDHRPNVAFFGLPNNPTGSMWPLAEIVKLAETYPDTLIVSDEAYGDYGAGTLVDAVRSHGNLVVLRTFSKLGLAALRIGFLVASSGVIAPIDKLRPTFNIGGLNQAAAAFLLGNHVDRLRARIPLLIAERQRVERELGAHAAIHVFPSQANFVLFRYGTPGDGRATKLWNHLIERGVVIRNCDMPGPLSGCLRTTIGTTDENTLLLDAVRELA